MDKIYYEIDYNPQKLQGGTYNARYHIPIGKSPRGRYWISSKSYRTKEKAIEVAKSQAHLYIKENL